MFNIIFSADEGYIKYTAVLITSIIHNTKKDSTQDAYAFHILTDSITQSTKEKLEQLELELKKIYPCQIITHIIDDKIFANFPISGAAHSNHLPYYRLKWSEFIKPTPQKCLYLDSDMLCLCDLRELFALPLGDNILGVVGDCGSKNRKIKYIKDGKKHTHYFDKNYFNSGLLLFNTKPYLENEIPQKCEQLARICSYIKAADQDLLNATIAQDRLLKLPFSYNFQCITLLFVACSNEREDRLNYNTDEFKESLKNPKILHFGEKPWRFLQSYNDFYGRNINDIWWDYAKITPAFNNELLANKENITEYKLFATLGFYALEYSKGIFTHFLFSKLLDCNNDKELLKSFDRIPADIFGLCCMLGEIILFARRHKKGVFNVITKVHKLKRQYKLYSTERFK